MKKILITLISVAVAIVAMAAGTKLWVHSHSGNHLSIDIADLDSIGFTNDGSGTLNIKDACGNTYKCVTIGSQVWMAENMRCNKYDTQSERAGATLSTSSSKTYAPYYTNGRNATTSYSGNLTSEQRSKLGYLYNWAAAVGLATESAAENQTSSFSGNRQGICPNGWHIPTRAEWDALKTYIEETDGKGGATAGKHLKTTSGWYSGESDYKAGADTYSFAALPAGGAVGSTVGNVGCYAYFWTATPLNSDYAYYRYLYYDNVSLYSSYGYSKYYAQSVRCVKNIPVQSVSLSKSSHNFQTIGESVQLTATVLPSDASNPNVTWKSSDTSVATVSDKGLVTCTGFGSASITATADGKSATCNVSATKISVQSVTLSKTSYAFVTIGQTLQLTATVLPSNATYPNVTWETSNAAVATVSDNGLVTCNGFGDATITATADGKSATCSVHADDGTVTDVCGNKYKYITIGSQVWMAENMRCNKYDTQSERAGATLSTSSSKTYAPYYTNGRNATTSYSGNLTSEQRSKLGYLYNWAAAVGFASESAAKNQASSFSGNRQGICPNGWHIPTRAEWDALKTYIEETDGKGGATAGKHLKTTSGWYSGKSDYKAGADTYSFAALPAGSAYGSTVGEMGSYADFWTATPYDSGSAYYRYLFYNIDSLNSYYSDKSYAQSVRCVRN